MPEGDTIRWHANRLRPVLEGNVPEVTRTHRRFARDRWPERLAGRRVASVDARGKHLLIRFAPLAIPARDDRGDRMSSGCFEDDLLVHSHLGMVGTWGVYRHGRRWGRAPGRAWLVLEVDGTEVVQFDGSTLELMTAGRARFDQRLTALGPDILAEQFPAEEFPPAPAPRRPHPSHRGRPAGPANRGRHREHVEGRGMLGRRGRSVADGGRGKRRGGAPDRGGGAPTDDGLRGERPALHRAQVYGRAGQPCPRCATAICSRGQGEENRLTFWCPGCQV